MLGTGTEDAASPCLPPRPASSTLSLSIGDSSHRPLAHNLPFISSHSAETAAIRLGAGGLQGSFDSKDSAPTVERVP